MTEQAEKLLTEIRDICAEMLAETRAEAERQGELRAQYGEAVARQRTFQRFGFLIILAVLAMAAFYLYR